MTRMSGSVPEARTRTRPRPDERRLLALNGIPERGRLHRGGQRLTVGGTDVDQALRQLLHRPAVAQVAALQRLQREQRAGDAVAGGPEAQIDDVAGLLAAQRPAAAAELVEHVAVADGGHRHLHAGLAHRGVEAVVRHHRDRDAAAGQAIAAMEVQRGQRHQLVAVDDLTGAVDGQDPVAVAVEGERHLEAAGAGALDDGIQMGGAAAVVDVAPVGLVGHRLDLGAEAAEDLRRGAEGRAVGAVQQDAPTAEVQPGEALVQRPQVVLQRAVQAAARARSAPGSPAAAPAPPRSRARCRRRA